MTKQLPKNKKTLQDSFSNRFKNTSKKPIKQTLSKSKKQVYTTADGHIRPDWENYFMSIAELVGSRGTCDRGRAGCVIVKNKMILVTGYVGSPIGLPHCDEIGHEMHKVIHEDGHESAHCIRTIHAEQNAVAQAARLGISLDGSTVYCKMVPCYVCAKILMNSGIKEVIALRDYHASFQTKKIFKEGKIHLTILKNETQTYKHM